MSWTLCKIGITLVLAACPVLAVLAMISGGFRKDERRVTVGGAILALLSIGALILGFVCLIAGMIVALWFEAS